jgi:hypothetical protein
MAVYFQTSKECFLAEVSGNYKDLGEHELTLAGYTEMLKTGDLYDHLSNKK